MNSIKLMLAAVVLGAFTLSVAGCPKKAEEAAPAAEAPAMEEATTTDEATDEAAPAETETTGE